MAVVSVDPTSGAAPLTVSFAGSGSADPDGNIVSFAWDFGDGQTSSEADPTHTYATPGTYTVRLTVTGSEGSHTEVKSDYVSVTGVAPTMWTDYRVSLTMRSDDDDAFGVLFRYQDKDNYYRFSWDRVRATRRLVKRENGLFTLLAEDREPYVPGQTYQVEIVAQGANLEIWIDGARILSVTDASLASGTIGLYTRDNQKSYFDDVLVEELGTGTLLLADDFDAGVLNGWTIGWTILDEATIQGPSGWSAATGTLVQDSNIDSDGDLAMLGTLALYTTSEGL